MRAFLLSTLTLALAATTCLADEVPLLDGHTMQGRVLQVTADGLELEGEAPGGGTFKMKLSADHIEPYWWYDHRDEALGKDVGARLELSLWAAEHGLFRQSKAQFDKARKLDPAQAKEFQDHVVPKIRSGIATDLVKSARREMDAGKLKAANKMLQAVLTRFGDTHAASDARDLLPTLHHRMDAKLQELAHWKKFTDDEKAREQSDQRRKVTDPIVALIRQGHRIMADLPPIADQADSVDHTRQAAKEYEEASSLIDRAEKAYPQDKALMARLEALDQEAHGGLVQSHVTAGSVYVATGDYDGAAGEANALQTLAPDEAHALRASAEESQSWSEDGISYGWRSRRAGAAAAARR